MGRTNVNHPWPECMHKCEKGGAAIAAPPFCQRFFQVALPHAATLDEIGYGKKDYSSDKGCNKVA